MHKSFIFGTLTLLVVLGIIVTVRMYMTPEVTEVACTMDAKICPDGSSVGRVGPHCEFAACPEVVEIAKDPVINLFSPKADTSVTSPIGISGEARGAWFTDGSFTIYLLDAEERIIAEAQAVAQSDWMTEDFVPFSATLSYILPTPFSAEVGSLVLLRGGLEGAPSEEDMRKIPIRFPQN